MTSQTLQLAANGPESRKTPDTKTSLRVTRFWDKTAPGYRDQPLSDPEAFEHTLARTLSFLGSDADVLELGCGTGTAAVRLAPHVASYHATDISSAMIDFARERGAQAGAANMLCSVGTPTSLAVDAGYDAILAYNVLHLDPDLEASLAAIRASLKPGGVFISKTPCLKMMTPLITAVMIPAMRLIGKAPYVRSFGPKALETLLERAGLSIEHVEWHGTPGTPGLFGMQSRDTRPFIVARRPA